MLGMQPTIGSVLRIEEQSLATLESMHKSVCRFHLERIEQVSEATALTLERLFRLLDPTHYKFGSTE